MYFDNNSKVTSKSTATYFKVSKPVDNGFKIQKYTIDNQLMYMETYKDREHKIMNGPAIYYYNNRKIDKEGKYADNKRDETWKYYFDSGQIAAIVLFKNEELIEAKYFDQNGQQSKIARKPNEIPSFNGTGFDGIAKYIKTNLKYPEKAFKNNIQGKVVIAFTINKDGHVTDAKVDKSINEELDNEALRIINTMPDWTPDYDFNRPVSVRFVIPITFELKSVSK